MANKIALQKLENSLDVISLGIEILKKGIGYYVYYNKPNEKTRNFIVHQLTCGQCAWGTGKIPGSEPGKNGFWIGPFSSKNQATQFINENFSPTNCQLLIFSSCIK
jgi:hypothetical protein